MKRKALVIGICLLGLFAAWAMAYWNGVNLYWPEALLREGGVYYTLPVPRLECRARRDFLRYRTIGWTLEVCDGELFLNGDSFGSVMNGDYVHILPNGRVSVNGAIRQPSP